MTLYESLLEAQGPCALLESALPGPLSRRSLLARYPHTVLVADAKGGRMITAAGTWALTGDPLGHLRKLYRSLRPGRWPDEGAIVGALAYDWARPRRGAGPLLVALAVDRLDVMEDGVLVAATHPKGRPTLVEDPRPHGATPPRPIALPPWSSLSREAYHRLVHKVQEHIAAGDVYQANLSQQFRLPWPLGGLRLYAALRQASPSPFGGYLRVGGLEIVSSSPERLLEVEDGRLASRPIAGTRPRSRDAATDRALAAELLLSEKERAEHLMLVDLARNDLGRVAEIGSVAVDELMTVEEYSHVRHIVSNVVGRLAPGRDALDALRALFPGGTITGVPKIRCMEILDALEPVPRGFYTGSLFYLTASGRMDANILIRSAVVEDGTVTFHTGGGIVADSDPEREYQETLHKAEGMRVALEAALDG